LHYAKGNRQHEDGTRALAASDLHSVKQWLGARRIDNDEELCKNTVVDWFNSQLLRRGIQKAGGAAVRKILGRERRLYGKAK